MATKYKASEECINANDARFAVEALNEHIKNQKRIGAYVDDIKSTATVRDAIKRVLDHASLEHDDICFVVNIGVRP
jgi:RNase P protein component